MQASQFLEVTLRMGTLYVVATPIGNLEDVTLRALRTLRETDRLFAEDTRRARILLDHHGVAKKPRSLHAHNEAERSAEALEALEAGERVALISDAGTPLVSDPGERLVAAAARAGHEVVPIPGASALLSALVVSGLPATPFSFVGFPPRRAGERGELLAELASRRETLVFFESPKRIGVLLAELAEVFGERPACVARELSKIHEEAARGTLSELAERYAEGTRGEVTLVVAGAREPAGLAGAALEERVRTLLGEGMSARDVAAELAPAAAVPKRDVYALAVKLRGRS